MSKNIKLGNNTLNGVSTIKVKDADNTSVYDSFVFPEGKKSITNTSENDVSSYATAQVSDANLIASNIKKDVSILGVTGSYEGGGNQVQLYSFTTLYKNTSYGGNPYVPISYNNNGKFLTDIGVYVNDVYKGEFNVVGHLGSNYEIDNKVASDLQLTSGSYKITAKNADFIESEKSGSVNANVTLLSFNLTNCTKVGTIDRFIKWNNSGLEGVSTITLTADDNYTLPDSITLTMSDSRTYTVADNTNVSIYQNPNDTSKYAIVRYEKSSSSIIFRTYSTANDPEITSIGITCIAEEMPQGHTVTINLDGSTYYYNMSYNTLVVDGVSYYVNGGIGSYDTDFPSNGTQITASVVSISGDGFRWKDSDTSSWQEDIPKTWNIPRDNFEIWIEVTIDE